MTLQAVIGELSCSATSGGQDPTVRRMQAHLLAGQQITVDRLLQQRMTKHVAFAAAIGDKDTGPDRFTQAVLKVGLRPARDLGEQPVEHPPTGHRRHS
jgi:hypothetical protein